MTKIKVALRVRPRSVREVAGRFPVVVGVDANSAYITDIKVPERPSADSRQRFRQFDFDHAFWLSDEGEDGATQEEVYEEMGTSLEESILEGYNACLLAYGQSSTGKTHTMLGTKEDPGLILRLCQGLWKKFKRRSSSSDKTFRMDVSFMEIYREKVRDLLAPSEKPLKLREHPQLGPHVQGLKRIEINEGLSILDLLWEGEKRRATGATGSNRHSSRSHAIWTVYLTSTRISADGSELITRNQVHLVDLAGSERADLATTKNLLAEGKDINRSLVSLGNVISSLAERAQYIPYRDSTLTWFLKDSLGGNATTAIIITASPASSSHAQTLNSLRFAQRARLVENQPKINVTKYEGRPKHKRNGERTGIFSGISAFDLKKDISRLAGMIRSAQANGGILRSLTPSNGWNRLISAIENWSHLDSEQEQDGRSNQQNQSTSMETLTTSTSVADGQVQVDFKSDASNESSDSSGPLMPEANKSDVNEVFIPLSSSFKCLTWRQQEIQQIPPSNTSDDEVFVSLPSTPKTEPKVNHLKYMVPVYFPVTRNVETEGRICERIHGTIDKLSESYRIYPTEVRNRFETPLVRGKFPTLVNPQHISHPFKESCSVLNTLWDENLNYIKSVQSKGTECNFSFNIPNVSEFSNVAHYPHSILQSTDEEEEPPCQPVQKYRTLRGHRPVAPAYLYAKQQNTPGNSRHEHEKRSSSHPSNIVPRFQDEISPGTYPVPPKRSPRPSAYTTQRSTGFEQEQNDTGIDPGNSFSDSSSYESLQILTPKRQLPVKIVSRGDFNFAEIEEKLENCASQCICRHKMASVSYLKHSEEAVAEFNRPCSSSPEIKTSLDCSTSHFQKFFVRELTELENIGQQLKNLKQKTERYNRLKPYLSKIEDLVHIDHSIADSDLDAEIEQCSGWNVGIEFQKVQNELSAINKILNRGASIKPNSESSLSAPESSGSISLDSHRSSDASISNNDADVFVPVRPTRLTPSSKSAPILTSTPKNHPPTPHVPPTFWSDFYKRSGPREDGDHLKFGSMETGEDQQFQPRPNRWRPFLPKTHSYLCHQSGYTAAAVRNIPNGHYYHSNCIPTPNNHYQMYQQQKRRLDFQKQHHKQLRSLSSEGGSSLHDGSQSDQYASPTYDHGSAELCSCPDSLDSNCAMYWDASIENDFLNHNLHHHQNQNVNPGNYHRNYDNNRPNTGNRQLDSIRRDRY